MTLTLTRQSFTTGDQSEGQFALLLKNMGETFDDATVTWNSLTPDGGNVSGTTLSTVAGYDASIITSATFSSSASFVSAAQTAADGSNILSLIIYSPAAEAIDTSPANNQKSFYRFNDTASLTVTVVPEPSTVVMLLGAGALLLFRRRRV